MTRESPACSPSEDDRKILRTRALALARPPTPSERAGATLELLEFRLAQESYALESRHVREVYPLCDLTPWPCTPAFICGVCNVRGYITPVIDLKKFFDLPDRGLTDLHRIIVVDGQEMRLGLLADVVVGARTLALDSLQASLPTLTGIRADYLKGVTADGLVVLDIDRMLADPKLVVHEEVAT